MQYVRNFQCVLIITFANYAILVSDKNMPVKIGEHLFDSISAKERVVCKKNFNESILISNT